jgi:hypothetical protein
MTKQSLSSSFRFYMPARCKFGKHENVHTATGYVKRYLGMKLMTQLAVWDYWHLCFKVKASMRRRRG